MVNSSIPAIMAMRSLSSCKGFAVMVAVVMAGSGAMAQRTTAPTSALTLGCPARLQTTQTAPATPGWEAYHSLKGGGRLASTGFYLGPVAGDAELKPNGGRTRGNIVVEEHNFYGNQRIYFACRYQDTEMVLSRPLPLGIKRCTITSDTMKPAATDDVIVCR